MPDSTCGSDRSHGDPFDAAPDFVTDMMRAHQMLMSRLARDVALPPGRFLIIRRLQALAPHTSGIRELARWLGVSTPAASQQLKQMARDELIVRTDDTADKRRTYVTLSHKGFAIATELEKRCTALARMAGQGIGRDDLARGMRVLGSLRRNLERLGPLWPRPPRRPRHRGARHRSRRSG